MTSYKVTLIDPARSFNRTIEVPETETILNEAFEQGIKLPFECVVGACAACSGKLTTGAVDQSEQIFLNDDQIAAGEVLLCVAKPLTDCTVEVALDSYL